MIFNTDIYKIIFSMKRNKLFYWSVNIMIWLSKFHNIFWHAQKFRQDWYLTVSSIVLYGKLIFNTPVLFKLFSCGLKVIQATFLAIFLVSKLYDLSLYTILRISEMSRGLTIIYLGNLRVLLFMENSIWAVCTIFPIYKL